MWGNIPNFNLPTWEERHQPLQQIKLMSFLDYEPVLSSEEFLSQWVFKSSKETRIRCLKEQI
jgi:hypothetical protein